MTGGSNHLRAVAVPFVMRWQFSVESASTMAGPIVCDRSNRRVMTCDRMPRRAFRYGPLESFSIDIWRVCHHLQYGWGRHGWQRRILVRLPDCAAGGEQKHACEDY
jgi:hypothetical protein